MPENASGNGPEGAVQPCPLKLHWIEIELLDADGKAVPNEAFTVKLPSGDVNTGYLNSDGFARVDAIPDAGTCQVSFPNLDSDDWAFDSSTSASSVDIGAGS